MNNVDLQDLITTHYKLMFNHKISLAELENMLPWEHEIYIRMFIADENTKQLAQSQTLGMMPHGR